MCLSDQSGETAICSLSAKCLTVSKGIKSILLFGIPEHKDETGEIATHDDAIVQRAIMAIKSGMYFTPREESNLFGHKYANDFGLKPQMYYRQCNLFVRYLINQNPEAFKDVYLTLIKGVAFKDVWVLTYGQSIPELWQGYLNYVQA